MSLALQGDNEPPALEQDETVVLEESAPQSARPFVVANVRLGALGSLATIAAILSTDFAGGWIMIVTTPTFVVSVFGILFGIRAVLDGAEQRNQGATVSLYDGHIDVWRPSEHVSSWHALGDCSWYEATPRSDSRIGGIWVFVFPCPRVLIIRCPRPKIWRIPLPSERVVVGWTEETRSQWKAALMEHGVPFYDKGHWSFWDYVTGAS